MERRFVGEPLGREACPFLDRCARHPFTSVDGTGFAPMGRQRIRLAFDAHFATAGFARTPLGPGPDS